MKNSKYIFSKPNDEYKVNLHPVDDYLKQAAGFISKNNNIPIDEAKKHVISVLTATNTINPIVTYREKQANGDRKESTCKLTHYIKDAIESKSVIVPSFTTYVHPSEKKSLHSEFLQINIDKRKIDKANAFKYKQAGDSDKFLYYNTLQKVRKIFNNSLSGAYASKSTILYNPSAHYSLTSITRSLTSIGNAVSESMLMGNKYFKDPKILLNYIIAIVTNCKSDTVQYAIDKYRLYIPTVDEVMEALLKSSRLYWEDLVKEAEIRHFLTTLTSVELVAIMYTNDFYHIRKYNSKLVWTILDKLSTRVDEPIENPLNAIESSVEGTMNLVHHIVASDIKGMKVDYKKLVNDDPKLLNILASTANNVSIVLNKCRLLFRTFFVTDIMPIKIAEIKDALREVVVLSDTDSTTSSYGEWVRYFKSHTEGDDINMFDDKAVAVSASVMFINTSIIDHNVKIFANNMNVDISLIDNLKMKGEFFWKLFDVANVSKTYFASVAIQEGNVFKENDLEIKGVHLIASSIDQKYTKMAQDMMTEINEIVIAGNKIRMKKYITQVADIEREILDKIDKGDINIFKKDKIKESEAYKLDDKTKTPYLHHLLWEEVFKDKYGTPGDPTYMVIKIPTILKSKAKLNTYLDDIEDPVIKEKMVAFVKKYNRTNIGTFRTPIAIVGGSGVPKEIIPAIDRKRVVLDTVNAFYIILATIGFYVKDSLLISEMGY